MCSLVVLFLTVFFLSVPLRVSAEENPVVASVYKKIIKDRAHELLHVHYKKH